MTWVTTAGGQDTGMAVGSRHTMVYDNHSVVPIQRPGNRWYTSEPLNVREAKQCGVVYMRIPQMS